MRTLVLLHVLVFFVVSGYSFVDDHNDGVLIGWTTVGDRLWKEANGVAMPEPSNMTGFLLCDSLQKSSNAILKFTMSAKQWEGNLGGVIFCFDDPNNFYYLTIEPQTFGSGTITFYKNSVSTNTTVLANNLDIPTDFFTLQLELSEESIIITLNDKEVGTIIDNSNRGGSFGYYHGSGWSAGISIDEVSLIDSTASVDSSLTVIRQPQNASVYSGGNVSFDFEVLSSDSTMYQWFKNGVVLEGARAKNLVLENVTYVDSGATFHCVANNSLSTLVSDTVRLIVNSKTRNQVTIKGTLKGFNKELIGIDQKKMMDLQVTLFKSMVGGEPLYQESFVRSLGTSVIIDSGNFVVKLGAVDSLDIVSVFQENESIYAEFSIANSGNSPEVLKPRIPITATPYSISSNSKVLKGEINPNTINLDAPIGTFYIDKSSQSTYIKASDSWVLITN